MTKKRTVSIALRLGTLLLSCIGNFCVPPVSCSVIRENSCIPKPINTTCVNHDTYLNYTDDIEYLLQLENAAVNYIEANVTNQYCRSYIKAALCVTVYPPCNGGVQKLCSEECDHLLDNGECSSDIRYLTEYISTYFDDFTINCSDSLSFANDFLSTVLCQSSECVSLLTIAETPASCFSLQTLKPEVLQFSQFSVSLNTMTFKYTSESDYANFYELLKVAIAYLPDLSASRCLFYAAFFVYNYVFIPCNLTTGTPRPLCSSACYVFRDQCEYQHTTIITFANLYGFPLSEDCENTLNHISRTFNYSNSSKDFENDCVDFPDYAPSSTGTVGSSNTNSHICSVTNDNTDSTTIFSTSTINAIMTSSATDYPFSGSTPIITNANNSSNLNSRPVVAYPVILSSVAGSLLGLCFMLCIVGLLLKRKFGKKQKAEATSSAVNSLFYRLNTDLKKGDPQVFTDMDVLKKEYQDLNELLIPACKVELTTLLGEGEFGKVYKGTWVHKSDNGDTISQVVAVKTIKGYSSVENLKSILRESILMKDFDHPNVLSVLGVGFDPDSGLPFVVLPFMVNGDLKTYLKSKRQKLESVDYLPEEMDQGTLLDICCQIAHGMNYLTTKKIVHRDLAARNCMVGDNLNIKVADFGLARDVCIKEYYRQQGVGRIPVKWMAPETLHDKISNEKTDVWSYGITCWEVYSLGRTPYPAVPNHEILKYIDKGNRPKKPNLCTDTMYGLMLKCWEADANSRICFKEIIVKLTGEAIANDVQATESSKDYVTVMPCATESSTKNDYITILPCATESSTNNEYVTVMPCATESSTNNEYAAVTPCATETSTNNDYITVMPCSTESSTESSPNNDYATVMPCTELAKEPTTENCAIEDYVTVKCCHEINS